MMSRRSPGRSPGRRLNLRILATALCISLICGAATLLDPFELSLRAARDKLRIHPPSGQTVIVEIDDRSVQELGPTPWPRARLADLIDRLHAAGARRIALDIASWPAPKIADDARFEKALANAGGIVLLPVKTDIDSITGRQSVTLPDPRFASRAQLAANFLAVDWSGMIYDSPYAVSAGRRTFPSFASMLADRDGPADTQFPIDYALNAAALPTISASDVLHERWDASAVADKDVLIGVTSTGTTRYGAPGFGLVPVAFVHAAAIETLREGRPVDIGWLAPMLATLLLATAYLSIRGATVARALLASGFAALFAGPILAESHHLYFTIMPALVLLSITAGTRLYFDIRRSFRSKALTNPVSGLPNLNALREAPTRQAPTVVVARMPSFAEVTTALPTDSERELVEQIVNRLSVGAHGETIYQADAGLFIWIVDIASDEQVGEQLMALHALFRSPVVVAGRLVDLSVAFGLDTDTDRPLLQRVSSATVAADRAIAEGRRWLTYDPAELEDAEWKMSLLARLDQAVERGEIWVAYQPKIDLMTGRTIGAEALARWSHPEKGEIPPSQFIPAAERSGRIENLTAHILDIAVSAATAIQKTGLSDFGMAVNLSATLLDSPGLLAMIQGALDRHGLDPHCLILEITETTAMTSQDAVFDALEALSAMGVRLSIDDYGTGFSTLDYLKRIPADEIKIDRSFVSMLEKSKSDRIMVHSTIQLAHSLGRRVVAEGVENANVLHELRLMRCDYVQGYHTGRPANLSAFVASLATHEATVAA